MASGRPFDRPSDRIRHNRFPPPPPPLPPNLKTIVMLHLHGTDSTFDEKTDTYEWNFKDSMNISSIQLVDFDIPVPPQKEMRLFIRVPQINCIQESHETDHDLCYMVSLYTTEGNRITERIPCTKIGQEIPVTITGNKFSIRITDQDGKPIKLQENINDTYGNNFDFVFKVK
jgi:hypothetical protein